MVPDPPAEEVETDHELTPAVGPEPATPGAGPSADSLSVLQQRLALSQAAQADALTELREVMTDEDALAAYGIDTSQL